MLFLILIEHTENLEAKIHRKGFKTKLRTRMEKISLDLEDKRK